MAVIKSKDHRLATDADTPRKAFKQFFDKVASGDIPLKDVGQIVTWVSPSGDEGKNKPMRTVPILYQRGVMDKEEAMANLKRISQDMTRQDLEKYAEKDYEFLYTD